MTILARVTWFALDELVRDLFTQLLIQNINHRAKQNNSSWNVTCKSKLLIKKIPEIFNALTNKKDLFGSTANLFQWL